MKNRKWWHFWKKKEIYHINEISNLINDYKVGITREDIDWNGMNYWDNNNFTQNNPDYNQDYWFPNNNNMLIRNN